MSQKYIDLMNAKTISWINWNFSDDFRSGAVLKTGTCPNGAWDDTHLKESGRLVKAWMKEERPVVYNTTDNNPVFFNKDPDATPEYVESLSDVISDSTVPSQKILFEDSFENGLEKWTQDSQNDWLRSSSRRIDGSASAGVYGQAKNSQLISPFISLNGKTHITITFSWLLGDRLKKGEYLAFDISIDKGKTWKEYASQKGSVHRKNVWRDEHISFIDTQNTSAILIRFRGKMSGSRKVASVDNVKVIAED